MKSQNKNLKSFVKKTSPAAFPLGYTLVEVVVCVAIIAILSTFALMSIQSTDSTKASVTAKIAAQVNNAALMYKTETGCFPKEQAEGIFPPELIEYFREDFFVHETPIGGKWDWNGEDSESKVPGISVSYEGQKGFRKNLVELVDNLVDDGNVKAGSCFLRLENDFLLFQFSLMGDQGEVKIEDDFGQKVIKQDLIGEAEAIQVQELELVGEQIEVK